tara:strand:- start:54249 stop:54875 length:627 start_codon:yes stop_codon:yes gene_type:complete
MWAQAKVNNTYNKWVQVPSRRDMTGAEAAAAVMKKAGIHDVEIVEVAGRLTDHYDPSEKRLALSSENFRGTSLSAVGVAAHEAGHAIQHKQEYAPLNLRMSLIPITQFSSQLLPFVIFGGFIFPFLGSKLIVLGIVVYMILTLFQLVTLPVEFDASRRAKKELVSLNILDQDEMVGVNKTLDAAAWTYVAAFISSLGWLLYLVAGRRD